MQTIRLPQREESRTRSRTGPGEIYPDLETLRKRKARIVTFRIWLILLSVVPLARSDEPPLPPPVDRAVDFNADVRPIFVKFCYACHGPDKQKGSFRLDRKASALEGGDSGAAIVAGRSATSPLILHVVSVDPDRAMPPKGERLSAIQVGILRAWIDRGAKWPDDALVGGETWWSLRPLTKPTAPELHADDAKKARNPIDAFVFAGLRSRKLTPSPEADKRTLLRRVTYDLIGLPPTAVELEAFLADASPTAYEAVVDRLLASPRYGERWARHWLDVVHYGDTHGYDKDYPRPNAWPYRDYVIRSLNADKPYDRFVREQVAGDVLFPGTRDGIEALGFIAAGPWDFIGHAEVPESKIDGKIARHLDRDDMLSNTMNTFVSLTVQCAQCHNHKFDPIPQEDYYRIQASFAALDRADRRWYADPETPRTLTKLQAERAAIAAKKGLPEADRKRELARVDAAIAALPPGSPVYAGTVHTGSGNFAGTGATGKPRPIAVLTRGDVRKPGREVVPGGLSAIPGLSAAFDLPANHGEGDRRAALAGWLTDPKNPLTWRSIVNRVWSYHFGRGLVETQNDFGKMGAIPTHPELLDWLAAGFRDGDRSLKGLHRVMVTSAAYRRSSANSPAEAGLDAGNAYLWRMNRRRLQAEEVRDSVLTVSGKLDPKMYGPGFRDFVVEKPEHSPHYEYHLHDPEDPATHRRSVYRFLVRSKTQPFMTVLDCADPSMQVERRNETLSPLQALAMLNNGLMLSMAKHLAVRVEKDHPTLETRVSAAFSLTLGRKATAKEADDLVAYARVHGLANTCRVLFNLNEFVFLD